jgi:ketosteroid isomerase-like protein
VRRVSDENVEIVHRLGEALVVSGVAGAAPQFLHPEVEYEDDPAWPDYRTASGRNEVIQRFEDWAEAWSDGFGAVDFDRVEGVDDRVVAIFLLRHRGKATGMEQSHRWGCVFQMKDGLVIRFRVYLDPAEALRAAGVPE